MVALLFAGARTNAVGTSKASGGWGRKIWRNMKVFEDDSLSFTCGGREQSNGKTDKEFVKDLEESQTCEYIFYKTL